MKSRAILAGGLTALLPCLLAIALTGCRSEPERPAVAQVMDGRDIGASRAVVAGRADAPTVTTRRLWAGGYVDFYASSISPDGRYVTEIDWSTGDLAVRDLATGLLHRVTDKGPWEQSGDYAEGARFSPDGRRIAYAWYDEDTSDYEVRVLEFGVDEAGIPRGSDARVVYAGGGPQPASWVHDWASDDELLVGVYRPDNTRALALLPLGTGSLRTLKSFDWQDPTTAVVSPDRRFIAYDRPVAPDSRDRDIYLLSADGRRETRLVEGPGDDVLLGWLPDEGSLLFHTKGSGSGSVWRLPMSDGRPTGPAVLVRESVLRPEPIGFAGGAFHYGLVVETPAFVTATIDFEGRRLVSLPTRFEAPHGGTITGLEWSPDGQHVIHAVDHPTSSGTRIYLRRADGEVIRDWTFDLAIMRTLFRWAPDGKAVIVPARDDRARPGFVRIDLESGEAGLVRLFDPAGEAGRDFTISPDGRTLFFSRLASRDGVLDESAGELVAHDLGTGAERPIRRVPGRVAPTVSPDGKWLAITMGTRAGGRTIEVVPVEGGESRMVYRAGAPVPRLPTEPLVRCACRVLGWSADSRSLLFLDRDPLDDSAAVNLYRVSRDGGEADRIATIPEYVSSATLHPDGRTIAYRTGASRGEIWVMEGVGGSASAVMDTGGSR